MDNENKTKKAGRPSTKKTTTKNETETVEKNKTTVTNKKVAIPLDTLISCKSAVRGTLRYCSKRTMGYQIVWDDFGDEQFIELQELVSMRNTDLRFFKDDWIIIDDSEGYSAEDIMKFIRVDQYYKNTIDIDNFDSLFDDSPNDIISKVSKMSSGLKDTIAIRAKQLYNNGVLESLNRIKALEEALGIELIIRS